MDSLPPEIDELLRQLKSAGRQVTEYAASQQQGTRWRGWSVIARQRNQELPFAQFDVCAGGGNPRVEWIDQRRSYESILSDARIYLYDSPEALVELWAGTERAERLHVGTFQLPLPDLWPSNRRGAARVLSHVGGPFHFDLTMSEEEGSYVRVARARYHRASTHVDQRLLLKLNSTIATLLDAQQPTPSSSIAALTATIADASHEVRLAFYHKRKYETFVQEHRVVAK